MGLLTLVSIGGFALTRDTIVASPTAGLPTADAPAVVVAPPPVALAPPQVTAAQPPPIAAPPAPIEPTTAPTASVPPAPIAVVAEPAQAAAPAAPEAAPSRTAPRRLPPPPPPPPPLAQPAPEHKQVTGTIYTKNGGNWTIVTAEGAEIPVQLTPNTQLHAWQEPFPWPQFPLGENVTVEGQALGSSVTANSIRALS